MGDDMKWSQACPHCGYYMTRLNTACRRCGAAIGQPPPKQLQQQQVGPSERGHGGKAPLYRKSRPAVVPLVWLLLAGVLLLSLEAAALWHWWLRPTAQGVSTVPLDGGALTSVLPQRPAAKAPAGARLPAGRNSPAIGSGLPVPSGIGTMFEARPSGQITPLIRMTNASGKAMYFSFEGPTRVTKAIPPYNSIEFELPRGAYRVRAWSSTASKVQTGDAVFQERTRYTSIWQIVSVPSWKPDKPLRMGDIE